MIVRKIHLTQFRNYKDAVASFHPGFNLIVGNNGMGKTNLVDAIHYLALTKSNFSSGERFVIRQDSDFMRVQGEFQDRSTQESTIVTAKVKRNGHKVFSRNDNDYNRLSEHLGLIPLVIIAPKDILLILEGSSERRKFLDKCLVQCDNEYFKAVRKYRKIVTHRNAYLKSCQQTGYDKTYLSSLDAQLPEPAAYIHAKRQTFVDELEEIFIQIYQQISGKQETMHLKYKSPLNEQKMEEILQRNIDKDLILGRTTSGIHKDDLLFYMEGVLMKYFASQGQQKSLIYSLKLSQYQYLKNHNEHLPILILDDVFDKLDPGRVSHLIDQLNKPGFGQVFLTDTDTERLSRILDEKNLEFYKYYVENAELSLIKR